jgi:hypothetical protein
MDEPTTDQGIPRGADALPALFQTWMETTRPAWPDDAAGAAAELVLRLPTGRETTIPLEDRHVRRLSFALRYDVTTSEYGKAARERREQMTAVIVNGRLAGLEVGNLVAYALAGAAEKLFDRDRQLVHGRPGSWEAEIVRGWARFGGVRPAGDYADRLAELFQKMGQARNDGGQLVSDALGYAARELAGEHAISHGSGLRALAENSGMWAMALWRMAKPLNPDDSWEPEA